MDFRQNGDVVLDKKGGGVWMNTFSGNYSFSLKSLGSFKVQLFVWNGYL